MFRIGHAWDTHPLKVNRKLILGGLEIPSNIGLDGHSDADVVLHAIANAFLGSLALGDLGKLYPDNSSDTLNMDSSIILREVYELVKKQGYSLNNMDIMIYSEYIKIAPVREKMRESIAKIIEEPIENISIKATTSEKMGFIGRGEAIACECVLLVKKD